MPSPTKIPVGRQTKLQAVCAQLIDLAHTLGPGRKLPTVVQLRDSLGVSVATLSSALSELEAQKVLCRKHGVGIYVSPQLHHKAISLVCDPSFFQTPGASPFWQMLVEQVRSRAAAHQEALSFHFALPPGQGNAPLHDGLAGEIRAGRVHGILAVGLSPSTVGWIRDQRVPVVAFAGPAAWMVGLDNRELVRLAVERLAMQGCRRIGLWAPVAPFRRGDAAPTEPSAANVAFREALAEHGLAFDPGLVRENRHLIAGARTSVTLQEQGYRTALEVFGGGGTDKPDGIVSTDDMMAHGALVALQKLGVCVGEHVKIATHANRGSPVLLGWEDDLTVIEVDPAEIVQTMFEMLEMLMDGKTPPERRVSIKPRVKPQQRLAVMTMGR
jgi:DNA-binding LacI/PurR family transcriptional regulator